MTTMARVRLVVIGCAAIASAGARADTTTIHPIYAAMPDLPQGDEAHRLFGEAVARRKLGPVEVMDVGGPAAPRAKEWVRVGRAAVENKRFAEALTALDAAAAEVDGTGAAGLSPDELADLFLYQGMATQQADWKDLPAPLTEIVPPKAKEAYLRAVVLARDKKLLPHQFPPLAVESWKLALAEIQKRPHGAILVKAPSTALISLDAGPLKPGLLPAGDLVYGDHWIRVEDPGRKDWVARVPLHETSLEIDAMVGAPLSLDDHAAAAHAKRQGAAYGLVAELEPGQPAKINLRLVDADTGARRDATTVPLDDAGALEAAVMRLDEVARKARIEDLPETPRPPPALGDLRLQEVTAPKSTGPTLADDPGAWARAHWPLLTAVGAAVGAALVLGVLAANSGK